MKRIYLLLFLFLAGCANNQTVHKKDSLSHYLKYTLIYKAIRQNNLDKADDLYIDLKNSSEEKNRIFDAASNLAIAHMKNKEYILANFYIQQMLQEDSSNEFARYLLNKNQFLAAKLNANNQKYMENALKAMESNINLLTESDYLLLAQSMYKRITFNSAWSNKEIGRLYKRMNKEKAYKLYKSKIEKMGLDINSIYKPR